MAPTTLRLSRALAAPATRGLALGLAVGLTLVLAVVAAPAEAAPTSPVILSPANGSLTSDDTPTFSGTAEAATILEVHLDGDAAPTGTTTSDPTGAWSWTPLTPLASGSHTVVAVSTVPVLAVSSTVTFTIDATPPPAPVLLSPLNGLTTNNSSPVVSGTAEAGATVNVIIDGSAVGGATVDASGNWSYTWATPLSDGPHTFAATATDAAGGTGPSSSTNTVTVDTTAPPAPVITQPANGATTSTTPTASGTAEPGARVDLRVDGNPVAPVTADASGNWSRSLGPLTGGAHTVKARATDEAGNTGPDSATVTIAVDTTPPAAPAVTAPADGSVTSDTTPTFAGTAEAGATVTVLLDGSSIGSTTAHGGGTWSYTPGTARSEGPHTVTATATDASGNTSPESAPSTFTIDATAPAAPVINIPVNGSATSTVGWPIGGTAEAGASVEVTIDGTPQPVTPVDGGGLWLTAAPAGLADGPHTLRATTIDAAGNVSPQSGTVTYTLDTTPPPAPVITAPADGSTTDPTPDVTGTAEPGVRVLVRIDGSSAGSTTATGAGTWTHTVTALSEGPHTVTAFAMDAVGNLGPVSASHSFTVTNPTPPGDTIPPSAPTITAPSDGSTTADRTPTLSGTTEPAARVAVTEDGRAVCTASADLLGAWTCEPADALVDGPHTLRATAADAAGNVSGPTTTTFTVDATAPEAPAITAPVAGSVVRDTTPAVTGTAEAGAAVAVTRADHTPVCETAADTTGAWSCEPGTALPTGRHTLTATATDRAGNTSPPARVAFTIGSGAPAGIDTDHDGLTDAREATVGTDPRDPDTDGDRITDGREVHGVRVVERFEVCGRSGRSAIVVSTDPLARDTDHDGLSDRREVRGYRIQQVVVVSYAGETITIGLTRSNPTAADTDQDGLRDRVELTGSANKAWHHRRTDPSKCDTDRGGASDGNEVRAGSDPTRVTSTVRAPRWQVPARW